MHPLKFVLFLLCFIGFITASHAQIYFDTNETKFNQSGGIYLIIPCFMTSASSNLNPLLLAEGYPVIPRGNLNFGIGFSYRYKRFVGALDGLISSQTRFHPVWNSKMNRAAFTGNLTVAYYAYQGRWGKGTFSIYPFTGISVTDTNLTLSKDSEGDDLVNLLANPNNSLLLNHVSGGLIFGIGIDLHNFKIEDSPYISLRIGRRVDVEAALPWESRFTAISNSPFDKFEYWSVQLSMGGLFNW